MMNQKIFAEKILSHRLRGFDDIEMTERALIKACENGVKYLEVDTRSSLDHEIYIYHEPRTTHDVDKRFEFSKTASSEIDSCRYRDKQQILKLPRALKIFSERSQSDQILCLDIKDYGDEDKYISLVKKYCLEKRVVFVSWMPQILIRLNEIGTLCPMILSQVNLMRFSSFGRIVTRFFQKKALKIGHFVVLGENRFDSAPDDIAVGFEDGYVSQNVPEDLLYVLKKNNGGICVNQFLVDRKLGQYCKTNGLKLWVFSVNNRPDFLKYASRDYIDVVFCDNLPIFR